MDNDTGRNRTGGGGGIDMGAETVYGTHDDNNMVMSEKVNTWAAGGGGETQQIRSFIHSFMSQSLGGGWDGRGGFGWCVIDYKDM